LAPSTEGLDPITSLADASERTALPSRVTQEVSLQLLDPPPSIPASFKEKLVRPLPSQVVPSPSHRHPIAAAVWRGRLRSAHRTRSGAKHSHEEARALHGSAVVVGGLRQIFKTL
jgi:hypothetical protein